MLIPKKSRLAIYAYIFREGVCVAAKSPLGKHAELEVPNLYVIKAMQSLHSRNYVSYKFSWQWFYYSLTNEGIAYLREYLHMPEDVVPNTLKKSSRAQPAPSFATGTVEGEGGVFNGRRGDGERRGRDGYRGGKDAGGAGGDFNPEFSGRREGGGRGGRGGFRGRRGGRGGARGGAQAAGGAAEAAAPAAAE